MIERCTNVGQALRARQRGFLLNPFRFGTAAGPSGANIDSYLANLWGAYSIAKIVSAYAGSAIRVRRSSDNTEQDIGFSGTALDTASLATFVGANSAFIKTFYDQSGGGNHRTQTTSASQPRIVNAGVYDGFIRYDGTDDAMTSVNNSGTPAGLTTFLRGKLRSTGTKIIHEQSANYNNATNTTSVFYDSGSLSLAIHGTGTGTNYAISQYAGVFPNDNVHGCRFDLSQATSALKCVLFVNGVKQTRSSANDFGTLPSGNFTAQPWFDASRNAASLFADLNEHTRLIYEAAKSDSDCTAISSILAGI